jgi:putative ABC transport system permease protein
MIGRWTAGSRSGRSQATLAAAQSPRRSAIQAHTDWHQVREAYLFSAQLNTLFPPRLIVCAGGGGLIMTNSVTGAVLAQFRDIGVLKALGFTGAQVAWVYLGQNLVLGAVGGALGIVVGVALAPLPLATLARSLSTTPRPTFDPVLLAGVWGAVLVVVLMATAWPARRGARQHDSGHHHGYEWRASDLRYWQVARARACTPVVMGARTPLRRSGHAHCSVCCCGVTGIRLG